MYMQYYEQKHYLNINFSSDNIYKLFDCSYNVGMAISAKA